METVLNGKKKKAIKAMRISESENPDRMGFMNCLFGDEISITKK